jgi:hypothetical protein
MRQIGHEGQARHHRAEETRAAEGLEESDEASGYADDRRRRNTGAGPSQ